MALKPENFLVYTPRVLIIAAVPFYMFPSTSRWPGLLLLFAGLLFLMRFRKPFATTKLNPALLVFLLSVLGSVFVSYDLDASLPKLAGIAIGAAIFFLVADYSGQQGSWFVSALAFILVGLLFALVGLLGLQRPLAEDYSKFPVFYRLLIRIPLLLKALPGAELGINANELGGTLVWVLYPGIALLVATSLSVRKASRLRLFKSRISRWWYWFVMIVIGAAVLIIGAALILTQSRAAYLGLVLALPLIMLGLFPKKLRIYSGAVLAGVFIAFILLIVPYIAPLISAGQIINLEDYHGALSINTLMQRLQIWQFGLNIFRDFPLTGIGMNTFRYVVYRLYPIPCAAAPCDLGHAHNEILQAGLDLGLPGLLAFVGLNLVSFWMLFQLFLQSNTASSDLSLKLITLGLGGGLFAHFIFGIFDAVSLGAKPGILFWILLGLICGLYTKISSQKQGDFVKKPAQVELVFDEALR